MILLMKPVARVIGPNGVSVDGIPYWHPQFSHLKGEACELRIDRDDLSSIIVLCKDQVLVADSDLPSGVSEEDRAEVARRKKVERHLVRDYFERQQRLLAGRTHWDDIIAAKAAAAQPALAAASASGGNDVTVLTDGDRIADALRRAPRMAGTSSTRLPHPNGRGHRLPGSDRGPAVPPLQLMPDEPLDERPVKPPIFDGEFQCEQWYLERGLTPPKPTGITDVDAAEVGRDRLAEREA
jgi:hypothetical protein